MFEHGYPLYVSLLMFSLSLAVPAQESAIPDLLDRCADNLNGLQSWRLECEVRTEAQSGTEAVRSSISSLDLRFDGTSMYSRGYSWRHVVPGDGPLDKEKASYISLLWDGHQYTKYRKLGLSDPGRVILDDFAAADPYVKDLEIGSLKYGHQAACLMGYYPGTFARIDKTLREARTLRLREEMEPVNGVPCRVLEADTACGAWTVWLDPQHGFAVARLELQMSRDAHHLWHGRALLFTAFSYRVEISHFRCVAGVWIGREAVGHDCYLVNGTSYDTTSHTRIDRIDLKPDHAALGSFTRDDIPDGTEALIAPVTHITYAWQKGQLRKDIDEDTVSQIERMVAAVTLPSSEERDAAADHPQPAPLVPVHPGGAGVSPDRGAPVSPSAPTGAGQPARETIPTGRNENPTSGAPGQGPPRKRSAPEGQCGLFCLYTALRLSGRDVDYRNLVTAEYYGSPKGSTLAELGRAARAQGFHDGAAARLTTRALRHTPYWAILHVRAQAQTREYNHYELFLGDENGKARLVNPPEAPRLVDYAELAYRWDGNALFVSARPVEARVIFRPDGQALLLYVVAALTALTAFHLGRRALFASAWNPLQRRFSLLTAGQAFLIMMAAAAFGTTYHRAHPEALLANRKATASMQKAFQGSFLRRIGKGQVRRLLNTNALFVDARFAQDYELGHLPRAISLPVDANESRWKEKVAVLPTAALTVVYCQSASCKFAETVGTRLVAAGFAHVLIYRGGWMDWSAGPGAAARTDERSADGKQHSRV